MYHICICRLPIYVLYVYKCARHVRICETYYIKACCKKGIEHSKGFFQLDYDNERVK